MGPAPKLLAFDIDGTLIRSSGEVSQRVKAALVACREAGLILAVSTGRPWPQARVVAAEAGGMHYGVCLNGAVVVDASKGSPVAIRALSRELALEAAIIARKVLPEATLGIDMADGRHYWEEAFDPSMPVDMMVQRTDDILSCVDGDVLTWLVGSPDRDPDAVVHTLHPHMPAGTEVRPSGLDMAEIAAWGVSKASGLQIITDRHHITRDEVMAFGDGLNDLEMLAWAGHSVAMENAPAIVQRRARSVAPSNDDDGVAVVIEQLLEKI